MSREETKVKAEELLARVIEYSYTNDPDNHENLMIELAATLISNVTCSAGDYKEAKKLYNKSFSWLLHVTSDAMYKFYNGEIDYKIIGEDI